MPDRIRLKPIAERDALHRFAMLACTPEVAEHCHYAEQMYRVQPEAFDRMRGEDNPNGSWGGYKIENRTALIPIMGVLIPEGEFRGSRWGITSQEGLRAELSQAADDPNIDRIVLMVDSPGGYASGTDSTADMIRQVGKKKQVVAVVNGQAASAAYWLASQASKIVASPTSEIGSIGVIASHIDLSEMYASFGVKVTLIHSGARKADGNPYQPLTDAARTEIQARVDDLRAAFAQDVVAGRGGKIELSDVLSTEARTYLSEEAVELGLADEVGTLSSFMGSTGETEQPGEDPDLDDDSEGEDSPLQEEEAIAPQPEPEAAKPRKRPKLHRAAPAARKPDVAAARAASRQRERDRIGAILNSPHAKGQAELAQHLAFETDLPLEIAEMSLKAATPAPAKPKSLGEEMRSYKQPKLGPDGGPKPQTMSLFDRGAADMSRLKSKFGGLGVNTGKRS